MITKEELFSAADARLAALTEEESDELRKIIKKIKLAVKESEGWDNSIIWTYDIRTHGIYAKHILDVLCDLGYRYSRFRCTGHYKLTYCIYWDLKESSDGNS